MTISTRAATQIETDERIERRRSGFSGVLMGSALTAFCAASICLLAVTVAVSFTTFREAGFGDAYILRVVQRYGETGHIYADPRTPGAAPVIYGPLLFTMLSVPGRLGAIANPMVGPRIAELASLLLCVLMATAVTRKLLPNGRTWWWAPMMALSLQSMRPWALQLRGDFAATLCGLSAVWLLLTGGPAAIVLAGVCAGLATGFKLVYVAGLGASLVWFAFEREWKKAVLFAAGGLVAVVGVYGYFAASERGMAANLFALRNPVKDVPGVLRLLLDGVMREPLCLVGMMALPAAWRQGGRWRLPILFAGVSMVLACVLAIQSGANVNYFFEAYFFALPIIVYGAERLSRTGGTLAGNVLALLLLFAFVAPEIREARVLWLHGRDRRREEALVHSMRQAFEGFRVMSVVPDVTMLAPPPAVIEEPYVFTAFAMQGGGGLEPLLRQVERQVFDVVAAHSPPTGFRGVPLLHPDLRRAVEARYEPYCVLGGALLLVRRGEAGRAAAQRLDGTGCTRLTCPGAEACTSW